MTNNFEVQITVVFPVTDLRGPAVDRVRTWTHGQTLARERYRVVVASDGTNPSQEQRVAALLGPHDELLHVPGGRDGEMWNAGAARAGTPWLVFTEGHCLADPGCLEAVARWIATNPSAQAGNFAVDHADNYLLARISTRWFETIHARWRAPGEWPRLYRAGSVIRADVFAAIGGFEGEYGQFSVPLFAARLHARGFKVEMVSGAAVLHKDDERMRDHHFDTADFACGELDARACNDPAFFERYFGHAGLWTNQLREHPRVARSMARAVVAAGRADPKRTLRLATLLRPLAVAATAGIGLRVALHRIAVILDEFAIEHVPLPAKLQWTRFIRAHARVVHLTQLEWIWRRSAPPARPVSFERWPIERLGPDQIVGVHGLEEHRGHRLRWTEPVVLLRLAPSQGDYELRIETGSIRGDPLASVIAVVAGGRVLPRELLSCEDDGTLVIRLPGPWAAGTRDGVVLVCSALAPARLGVLDPRLLGLPILSIATVPIRGVATTMAAA